MLEYGWQIFCLSLVLSGLGNYILRYFAPSLGLFDKADGHRKLNNGIIPRAGGVGIFLALVLASTSLMLWSGAAKAKFSENPTSFLVLGAVCFGITMLGFLDDRFGLRGRNKFLGQFFLVLCLVFYGDYGVQRIHLFQMDFNLGPLAFPFAVFWFMGAINAANLLDGMDGLLASVGLVAAVGIGSIAFIHGQVLASYLAMMLAGALLGFLYFNRPPATIYLGDAGSMLIGLLLAAISLKIQDHSQGGSWMLAIPLAALILPVLDTSAAILRRKLTGRSIYSTDHGHLHHCLQREGFGRPGSLFIVILLSAIAIVSGFISTIYNTDIFAWAGIVLVCTILLQSGWFGRPEMRLVFNKFKNLISYSNTKHGTENDGILLHGNDYWHIAWRKIILHAQNHNYNHVDLNINAPVFQEAYHAQWMNNSPKSNDESDKSASFQIPILVDGKCVGRVGIGMGQWNQESPVDFSHLATLVSLLDETTKHIFQSQVLLETAIVPCGEINTIGGYPQPGV
ncbi:MAG: MraY family glycosyltransferase [Gemmataceae bacterium]